MSARQSPGDGILRLPGGALGRQAASALELLAMPGRLALQYQAVLSPGECEALVAGVYSGRASWTANFDGIQFTLGRAYYTHLEQGREAEYFDGAAASDRTVRRFAPGLQERMAAFVRLLGHGPVEQRQGWCGAGVHIFPAGGLCARQGGDLHFDVEGLRAEELASGAPALTCVLMLQPPTAGGGLRVWDGRYAGEAEIRPADAPARSEVASYGVGDLVVIDSRRLHQIMPFDGPRDRVSATLHAVYSLDDERWQIWF